MSKTSQSSKDKYSYEIPRVVRFINTESRRVCCQGLGEGEGGSVFGGCRVSGWEGETFWRRWWGLSHSDVLNATECPLKMVKLLCPPRGWDGEGGREMPEGGDMETYVHI